MTHYGLIFSGIGLGLGLTALLGGPYVHDAIVGVLGWAALGFVYVGMAYFRERPAMLGKRQDGRLALWVTALCLPVLVLNYAYWWIGRMRRAEAPSNEVAPGIHVGGLPGPYELPEDTRTIVDLTSEFYAHPEVRKHAGYRVFPILDDGFPPPREIEAIVTTLLDAPTPMLIHCAAGHGRSATLAAAVGIARGDFTDPDTAERTMQATRPRIRFKSTQRERLLRWYLDRVD